MKNQALVSVIMPLYNGALFLEAAVQSVLAQTYTSWELQIVDDGSQDGSYSLAKKLAEKDSRIFVFQHEGGANKGVSATRNLAIKKSKGEYLAFLDCDDVWLQDKLEKQLKVFDLYPNLVLSYSKAKVINEKGYFIQDYHKSKVNNRPEIFGTGVANQSAFMFYKNFEKFCWIPASTVIAKKSEVMKCGGFVEGLKYQIEDTVLFYHLFELGDVFFHDEVLMYYRIHAAQWNSKVNEKVIVDKQLLLLKILISKVADSNKKYIAEKYINLGFVYVLKHYLNKNHFNFTAVKNELVYIFKNQNFKFSIKLRAAFYTIIFLKSFAKSKMVLFNE